MAYSIVMDEGLKMLLVLAFLALTLATNYRYQSYLILQDNGSVSQLIGFFAISVVFTLAVFLVLLTHTIATNNGHGKIGCIIVRVFWSIAIPYSAVFGNLSVVRMDQWAAVLIVALAATWLVFGGHVTKTMLGFFRQSAQKHNSRLAVDSVQSVVEVIPYHVVAVVFVLGMQVIPMFYN